MSDSVLHQLTARLPRVSPQQGDDAEAAEDYGAFGWLRGVRDRALFLELRRKDGSIIALGYPWLERVEFDASSGLVLHFTGQRVRLSGRNLNAEVRPNLRLVSGLLRHKVLWIQEADEPTAMAADKRAIVIEAIEL